MTAAVQAAPETLERLHVRVCGQVQGVGFRPFVYRLAARLALTGWVLNDGQGVEIEVQGSAERVRRFVAGVRQGPMPLARVERVTVEARHPEPEHGFTIRESCSGAVTAGVTPDTAVCGDCLDELFAPGDRRYRYPFINCTQCGPRYTIVGALPYDRANTSMSDFVLCPACQREYTDPRHRRFHAEPNACDECGPRLVWLDGDGRRRQVPDVVSHAVSRLANGAILAVKGLGGFHLVCDARNAATVNLLRERKHRDAKPFAVMVANSVSIEPYARVTCQERDLLTSAERPIVLLSKQAGCDERLAGIAPLLAHVGVMLPYTPLQYLLFHEAAGRPSGTAWLGQAQAPVFVMTSANPGGEPLVIDNDEALARLGSIADGFVVHDRDIRVRCDDSVARCRRHQPVFVRRARGYTPRAVRLPQSGPPVLALGGWFKNTICLTRDDQAFVSQHIGDLDNAATCSALEEAVAHLAEVLELRPRVIAHDLHPEFHSTRVAAALAAERGLQRIGVQHHHAHLAAVAAEHGLTEPALGLALDGVGLGTDGGAWGGELLVLEGARFRRLGHLRPLPLPGGDRAAREPWRMAASALHALGQPLEIERRFPGERGSVVRQMLDRALNSPPTSSAGRLFDAAAALLGVREISRYEGQAAMELEALATWHGAAAPLPDGARMGEDGVLDFLPLLDWLAQGVSAAEGAAVFHATLAESFSKWVCSAAEREDLGTVVLGGGCLLNQLLSRRLEAHLRASGLRVLQASQLPPSDGGLSLGQAWVAMQAVAGG